MSEIKIEASWKIALQDTFEQDWFQNLAQFLRQEKSQGKTIYPPGSLIFNAFHATPFQEVKIVILGQDPYHNPGEAMGLSFSVPKGVRIPPSLQNVYQELHTDVGIPIPKHGDLSAWAKQGVFLLNAMLTVEKNKPGSHQKIGWQLFTDAVIRKLSEERSGLVFMLWGNFARKKRDLIQPDKHLILEAAHPSPLAGGAFKGCRHFSKANAYLTQQGKSPVDWNLSE
ncbi:MAG TPA: uracil-DNA glycosylase [Saprospiraceae bacterium]|nr:uracil-DNA glycosylase [Saprospiraceae bacterium]HMQ84262.1 uracil-DNA glycosylase [Saprospiraceae bacterium]